MLDFLTLKPDAFGLDISDLSLKIIKLKKRGVFLGLACFGQEPIEPGVIHEGKVMNQDKLVAAIKRAVKKVRGSLRTKYVVASLPEEKAFLQVIQMPKMPEEDLKSAVIYEAENYVPLPVEQLYIDSQIVRPVVNSLDHSDVLIAALPRKTVDPHLECLKKAGLVPKALEIESLAVARALVKGEVTPYPVLLLDLGETRTSFIIFSGYSLRFTSSIPVSAWKLTEVISKTLSVDLKEAEKLKVKYGIKKKEIFDAATPTLIALVEQIGKYLNYYKNHASHEHISTPISGGAVKPGVEKIFISGGGANLKGLMDFLELEFRVPVLLGNPWANILPEPLREVPDLPFEESLRYTTALGLALRGIDSKKHDY
ncbi:MAG: hypothetical protein G01um101430_8 [Parcubacteria group bacterium Gr01-1014_30]|nr:MAG: hypothetical protein G01um101430_8 [Parcubacteria group bacterium Gr01-1014_30]